MKKTLLSSMIIILMGLLGACSSNTSDKTSLSEQSVSENKTATPVAIEVQDKKILQIQWNRQIPRRRKH